MADSNSNLNIVVKLRDEASAALSRLSGDVSDLGGSLNFAGDKAGILAGALGALGAATFLKSSIDAFAEGEVEMVKFETIMKSLSPTLQGFRGEILQLADKALINFGFSNQTAAVSMARLLQATQDGDFAMRAFQAAMDLARYKGITLEDATQALILAFQGGGRLLKQFGIEVDDHASRETILSSVLKTTAGQAAAYSDTLKGKFAVVTQIFGEFQQAVGSIFAPALNMVINLFKGWIVANGGLAETIKGLMPVLLGLTAFFTGAVLLGGIAGIVALLGAAGISGTLIGALAAVGIAVGALAALWTVNWARMKESVSWIENNSIVKTLDSFSAMIGKGLKAGAGAIDRGAAAIGTSFREDWGWNNNVPKLAGGGIVSSPTFAMVGESGPEAIIPLSRAGGMGGVTVVLQGDFYADTEVAERWGNQLARIIQNQLTLALRS